MHYLVIDLGSSNCKVYLAEMPGDGRFHMDEVDRFPTDRSFLQGHITTNILHVYDRICRTMAGLSGQGVRIDAMGIDSWSGDYVILDVDSGALSGPVFYRDKRTDGYTAKVAEKMGYEAIYALTTQRAIPSATLCQLMAYRDEYPQGLDGNKKMLFIGDYLMYLFTGNLCSELSVASYSQLYNMRTDAWENRVFDAFEIPRHIQPPVVPAGTVLGKVEKSLQQFLGAGEVTVVAPAVHDTSSAAVAVPAREGENWGFLATGSWFLMSMEMDGIAEVEKSFRYHFSNTGLAFGKVLLKKNIMGMWLVQECKKQWDKRAHPYSYPEMDALTLEAEPFYGMVDTTCPAFDHPDNMVEAIRQYLSETGQRVPEADDVGQILRVLYESIVLESVQALEMLEDTSGKQVDVLYVIGGASRIPFLNQFLADATGRLIRLGPKEASAVGNALLQAYGMGQVDSVQEIRDIVRQAYPSQDYLPADGSGWRAQAEKYRALVAPARAVVATGKA